MVKLFLIVVFSAPGQFQLELYTRTLKYMTFKISDIPDFFVIDTSYCTDWPVRA